jgi:hypothetical protein
MAFIAIGTNTIHFPVTPSDPLATSQADFHLFGTGDAYPIPSWGSHGNVANLAARFLTEAILAYAQFLVFRPSCMPDQLPLAFQVSSTEMTKSISHTKKY